MSYLKATDHIEATDRIRFWRNCFKLRNC